MAELNFDDLFREAVEDDGGSMPQQIEDSAEESVDNEQPVSTEQSSDNTETSSIESNTEEAVQDEDLDYKALYEKEKHRTESWNGRLKARDKENETLKVQLQSLQAQIQNAANTKTEKDITDTDESVSAFLTEFPELAEPIKKMIESAVNSTRNEIKNVVEQNVTPLRHTMFETEKERHFNTINQSHSDFADIVQSGQLKEWIDKQPSFVRTAYERVYNQGNTSEVIDMLDQFKIANGVQQTADSGQKHRPTQAVRSRHSGVPAVKKQIAKDDFDGAWQAALNSE